MLVRQQPHGVAVREFDGLLHRLGARDRLDRVPGVDERSFERDRGLFDNFERHIDLGADLDAGPAHLPVGHRGLRVAHREHRALLEDREVRGRPGRHVRRVEVAAVVVRRERRYRLLGGGDPDGADHRFDRDLDPLELDPAAPATVAASDAVALGVTAPGLAGRIAHLGDSRRRVFDLGVIL